MPLSPTLLDDLRAERCLYRLRDSLFPGPDGRPLSPTTLQKAYLVAKRTAGVTTPNRINGLRRACATDQLAAGQPVERLQRVMGHRCIQTTLKYAHWLPSPSPVWLVPTRP